MNQQFRSIIVTGLVAFTGLTVPHSSISADIPDAGRLMDELQKTPTLERRVPLPEIKAPATPEDTKPSDGATVLVKEFRVSGNSIVSTAEIAEVLRPFENRQLSFQQLEQAAGAVSSLYKEKGYITSYAYLPRQEIKDGIVRIDIIEGKVAPGGIKLKSDESQRLNKGLATGIISSAMPEGSTLRKQDLERGLILLNELPGVNAKSTIVPGATVGTSELLIEAKEGRLFSGSLESDNFGNRYSGQVRGSASLYLNNPGNLGDLLGVKVITAGEGMNYVRPFYTLPINSHGTKLGFAYSWMGYALGKELDIYNLDGSANTISSYLTHSVIRSLDNNLFASLNYDYKMLADRADGLTTTDKNLHVVTLGLTGDKSDNLMGGGISRGSLTVTGGLLDLSGSSASLENDRSSAKSNGYYGRFNLGLARTQNLPANFSISLSGSCQFAFKNLDSSEKFSLGGASGVKAYPGGEANADEGYLLNAELRYDIPPLTPKLNMQLFAFYDHGAVLSLHKENWDGWQGSNPGLKDNYSLNGAGLGLNAGISGLFALRASWAWKVGDNPGASNNRDSNGKNDIGQLWLQGSIWF